MILATRLFFDLGRVKQRCNNRRGTDTNGHAGLYQFVAAFLIGSVNVVITVGHGQFSMAFGAGWEAA